MKLNPLVAQSSGAIRSHLLAAFVGLMACQPPPTSAVEPPIDASVDADVLDRGVDARVDMIAPPEMDAWPDAQRDLPEPPDAALPDAAMPDLGEADGMQSADEFVAPPPPGPQRVRLSDGPGVTNRPALVAFGDGWLVAWTEERTWPFGLVQDADLLVIQTLDLDGTPIQTDTVPVPDLRFTFKLQSDAEGAVVLWIDHQRLEPDRLMAIRWTPEGFSAPHVLHAWDDAHRLLHFHRVDDGWRAYVRVAERVEALTISPDATELIATAPLLEGAQDAYVAPPWVAWRENERLSWARLDAIDTAQHMAVEGRVRWLTGSSTPDELVLGWAIEDQMYLARLDEGPPDAPSVLPLQHSSQTAPVMIHDADGVAMGVAQSRGASVMRWTPDANEWSQISGPYDVIPHIDFAVHDGQLATVLTSNFDRRPDVWFVPGLPQPEPYTAPAPARCDATVQLVGSRGLPYPPRLSRENGQLRLFWPSFLGGHGWWDVYLDIYAADPAPAGGNPVARHADPGGRWGNSPPVFALGQAESWLVDAWDRQRIDMDGQIGPPLGSWAPRVTTVAAAVHGDRMALFGRAGERLVLQIGAQQEPDLPAVTVDLGPVDPEVVPFIEARVIANDAGFAVGWTHRDTPDTRPQMAVVSRAGEMRWRAEADAPWGASWSPRITWEGDVVSLAWAHVDAAYWGRADAYVQQWHDGVARPARRLTRHGTLGVEIGAVDGGYAVVWGDEQGLIGQRFDHRFEPIGVAHVLGGRIGVFGARRTPMFGALFEADQVIFSRYRDGRETTSRRRMEVGIRPLDCFGPVP